MCGARGWRDIERDLDVMVAVVQRPRRDQGLGQPDGRGIPQGRVACWQPPGRPGIGGSAAGVGRWRVLGHQSIDLSVDRCQQALRNHAGQNQVALVAEVPQLLLAEHPSDATAAVPPSAPEFPCWQARLDQLRPLLAVVVEPIPGVPVPESRPRHSVCSPYGTSVATI